MSRSGGGGEGGVVTWSHPGGGGGEGGVVTRSHVQVRGGGGRCCDQVPCPGPGGGGGRCCDMVHGQPPPPPPGLGQTDACENITFARFAKRAVMKGWGPCTDRCETAGFHCTNDQPLLCNTLKVYVWGYH